jgi:pimeloyl-ACP methyl ester carboxylesterase
MLADWRAVDWRAHQRWVQLDTGAVNVIDIGSGPPVLFVHGLGGSWPNWLEQLPILSQGRRAIALDLPGFGDSPMPSRPISIEGYARTLLELMDTLGVYSAAIVGNSMGGQITAELALLAPERVERIVLVSPAGVSTASMLRRLPLIRLAHPALHAITGWVSSNADSIARRRTLRERALATVATQPQRIAPEFAAEQIRGMGKPGFLPALEALVEHSQTLSDRLHAIRCPTLILWGGDDPLVPARDAEVFRREIPRAKKVVWEHTGHVAMFERAADFNALLDDFLREDATAPAEEALPTS